MACTVIRYVPTHINREGTRTLSVSAQGRYTFATDAEALRWIQDLRCNNPSSRVAEIYGAQALGTFEVRPCRCWAAHFDPVGIYFDVGS
jgi:hypothetical protein